MVKILYSTMTMKNHTDFQSIGKKLLDLDWDMLQHNQLFRSSQNFSNGKTFTKDDDLKSHLHQLHQQ